MRLAYIYQEGTNIKKANVYQSYSMVKAFATYEDVDWYRGMRKFSRNSLPSQISEYRTLSLGLDYAEKLSRLIFSLHTLIQLLIKKPDVIFTRDFGFLYFYSKMPGFLKVNAPIIFEAHKVYHRVSEKVSFVQELSSYSIVDGFVSVSEGIKDDLVKDFQIAEEDILVATNGIEKWVKRNIEKRQPGDKTNFIYAGSYGPWKGVETILGASLLLNDFKGHIYLVGIDTEIIPAYNQECCTIIPSMDRKALYEFYEEMDVGIVPTLNQQEGTKYTSPIKLFEYAYAELEILASDIPAIREIQTKGFNIEFFAVGNAQELASKMNLMTVERNLSYKENNSTLIDTYTWENRAKKILQWMKSF